MTALVSFATELADFAGALILCALLGWLAVAIANAGGVL